MHISHFSKLSFPLGRLVGEEMAHIALFPFHQAARLQAKALCRASVRLSFNSHNKNPCNFPINKLRVGAARLFVRPAPPGPRPSQMPLCVFPLTVITKIPKAARFIIQTAPAGGFSGAGATAGEDAL